MSAGGDGTNAFLSSLSFSENFLKIPLAILNILEMKMFGTNNERNKTYNSGLSLPYRGLIPTGREGWRVDWTA